MYLEKVEDWIPTKKDVKEYLNGRKFPLFEHIKTGHLSGDEKQKLQEAVLSAKQYAERVKTSPGLSFIMIAGTTENDVSRTGYGCGKTTLAKSIFYSQCSFSYSRGIPDSLYHTLPGKFYDARSLMAEFDRQEFDQPYFLKSFRNMLVIDDLGREGNLKWEKRDPEIQLQEKRDRYYTIINYCYENKVSLIVTSNKTSRELADFLGGASWSRLLEICPKDCRINMTGISDYRPLLAESSWF